MTLEQLTYFVSVYNYGSISKAAELLFVSQSTVSTSIARFEKEIGFTLFKRSKTGTTPTHHADMLINHAQAVLNQVEVINHHIFNQNNRPSHHLQISSVSSVAQYFLPEVIAKLFVISPNLHIELQEERLRKNIFKAIQDNCIDIGIVNHTNQDTQKIAEIFQKKGIQMEFLYSCSMSYYVRTDHPLLFVHHLDPQILAQYELISNEGLLEFSQNKIPFEHIHEEQNIRYIKQMLCVNDFIAILPDFYSENDPYIQNHQIVRLAQFPLEATTNFSALYNPQNEIAKYFIGFLKQEFAQLV